MSSDLKPVPLIRSAFDWVCREWGFAVSEESTGTIASAVVYATEATLVMVMVDTRERYMDVRVGPNDRTRDDPLPYDGLVNVLGLLLLRRQPLPDYHFVPSDLPHHLSEWSATLASCGRELSGDFTDLPQAQEAFARRFPR